MRLCKKRKSNVLIIMDIYSFSLDNKIYYTCHDNVIIFNIITIKTVRNNHKTTTDWHYIDKVIAKDVKTGCFLYSI